MTVHRNKHKPDDLVRFGPRLEIELGPPILRDSGDLLKAQAVTGVGGKAQFSRMPALIDTGAGRTALTPEATRRVGLRQIDEARLARAGGIDKAAVYVASIQFPRYKLATIEVIEVVSCELPEQPIQCLLGRDVLARWRFTYNGPLAEWEIEEEDVAAWIEPPEGIDM